MKAKLNSYNLAKGSLTQLQRKKTWVNYSLDIIIVILTLHIQRKPVCPISRRHSSQRGLHPRLRVYGDLARCRAEVSGAVCHVCGPSSSWRFRNLVKEWNAKYERLTTMVVPRSAACVSSSSFLLSIGLIAKQRH